MTNSKPAKKPKPTIILVINSGSSTIKYQLLDMATESVLLKGLIEGIGQQQGSHHYQWIDEAGLQQENEITLDQPNYVDSFTAIAKALSELQSDQPSAIGHRVVHGGEQFSKPTLIDADILTSIEQLSTLAPLHNPANILGIKACLALYPAIPQVAIFDTAFHQSMPDYAYRYAVPESWYRDYGIRRYGFHGTSHHYVANKAADYLNKPLETLNLISLHLGNGASAVAIQQGQCIDTSMGFTPLEGLMMGTRCGDIDPSIPLYIEQVTNNNSHQVSQQLNNDSGLKAIAGTADMREVIKACKAGDKASELAINMYCYRIKKVIGAYIAALGSLDAIIFTGGIGENSAIIRQRCCDKMETLGIDIDSQLNAQANESGVFSINSTQGKLPLLVIKTNEELQIAYDVANKTGLLW